MLKLMQGVPCRTFVDQKRRCLPANALNVWKKVKSLKRTITNPKIYIKGCKAAARKKVDKCQMDKNSMTTEILSKMQKIFLSKDLKQSYILS